ncbi:MAG: 30S ribosomal protein S8 [Candidatus Binatia bacterium]
MVTDPIADMLTCLRNALHARKEWVDIPRSRLKEAVTKVMAEEGFVKEYSVIEESVPSRLRVWLAYDASGQPIMNGLVRVSKPSLRTYVGADEIPLVQNGLGVNVLSTSRGIMTDRAARALHVGGEILCRLW